MDINVNNLNMGYDQCRTLNNLARTEGRDLLQSLEANIKNLRVHWIGNDAMVHINNLIKMYRFLGDLVIDAKKLSSTAGLSIIAIQTLQRNNLGGGNVGEPLDGNPEQLNIQPEVEPTERYFVDPAARNDYNDLVSIHSKYSDFTRKFQQCKDELLANWTAGAGHDNAVKFFNDFDENCGIYAGFIKNAEQELGKAIQNISIVAAE